MDRHWIRVLLVDDDEDDYILIRDMLEGSVDPLVELDWVSSYSAGLTAIARGDHDIYLIDYQLGASDGVDLIRAARTLGCCQPMLLLTGVADRRVDLAATAAGAAGFLLKYEATVTRLERSLRYALNSRADWLTPVDPAAPVPSLSGLNTMISIR